MRRQHVDERQPDEIDIGYNRNGAPEALTLSSNEQPSEGFSSSSIARRIVRPQTILSFVLAAAVILIAISRFDLNLTSVATQMSQANLFYISLAFVVYYGSFAVRAARWRSLLGSARVEPAPGHRIPGMPGMIVIFILSWFVNCLVPAKLGDAYRGYLLKQRARTSLSSALGTIFAERLSDVITLAVVLVASGLLVFGRHIPSTVSNWMLVGIALGVVLAIGTLVVYRFREQLRRLVPHRIRGHYLSLEQGALGSFGRVPTLLALTAIIWILEGVRLYFVVLSLEAGFTFSAALFVALLASLLTVVPVTPAGLGFVEVGVVGVLMLLGSAEPTAASIALLDRVVAYWSVIVVGAVLYAAVRWKWKGEPGEDRA